MLHVRYFQAVETGRIFPFLPKMRVQVVFCSEPKEGTAIALFSIMYDVSLTNNLLVVILFHS